MSFGIINAGSGLCPFTIHRVNLSQLPTLTNTGKDVDKWTTPNLSMFTTREGKLKKKNKEDVLMFLKDSLHCILVNRSVGGQSNQIRRVFASRNRETQECDTIFFIPEMRFDVQCHALIADAYELPLPPLLMARIGPAFERVM